MTKGKLAFSVDRKSTMTLTEQIVAGVRQAILCGDYPFGARVPSLRDAVRELKVSYKVAYRAYELLRREGWLRSSPRCGYTAAAPDVPQWRGEVLCVCGDGYADMQMVMSIQQELARAGWLCTNLFFKAGLHRATDDWILDAMLTRRFDLVVAFNPNEDAISRIQYAEKPFVTVTSCRLKPRRHCRGVVVMRMNNAIGGLVEECRRLRVRTVWCVNFQPVYGYVCKALREAGFSAKSFITGFDRNEPDIRDSIRECAYSWFAAQAANARSLPDLIVVLDDYVASAALAAFSNAGVRIPEDVQFVSFANSGNGQAFARSLAQLGNDLRQNGVRVAEYLIECLNSAHRRPVLELDAFAYRPGETFSRTSS